MKTFKQYQNELFQNVDLSKSPHFERVGKAVFDLIHEGWDEESKLMSDLLAELILAREEVGLLKAGELLKECSCGVACGELSDQVSLPYFMPSGQSVWCDSCLVPEVMDLWESGVVTVASCCGHRTTIPVISVSTPQIQLMKSMGYVAIPDDECSFFSRTIRMDPSVSGLACIRRSSGDPDTCVCGDPVNYATQEGWACGKRGCEKS